MNKYTATLTVLVFGAIYVVKTWTRRSRLPPGPRGWPLIGNLLDMPSTDEWRTYAQWVKEFSEYSNFLYRTRSLMVVARRFRHPTPRHMRDAYRHPKLAGSLRRAPGKAVLDLLHQACLYSPLLS